MNEPTHDALVIGAGPGGLAAAAAIGAVGLRALVIDRASNVGASWRGHYERLHLHTERALSGLPGLAIPRAFGKWVARANVVEYLELYAKHHELALRLSTAVENIVRQNDAWQITAGGEILRARACVIATGYNHTPFIPDWPGRAQFSGELLHSALYKNPQPYRGRDVLVVGTGNSGAEIAVDLVEGGAARVRVAVRTPPNIVPREVGGLSTQRLGVMLRHLPASLVDAIGGTVMRAVVGDLTQYGLPRSQHGVYTRARMGVIPILDVGFIDALKQKKLSVVGAVEGFAGRDVLLAGGERVQPEAVIMATGFVRALEKLAGHLGVLDEQGLPRVHGPHTHPSAPHLHFIGYTNPISGNFREMAIDAKRIARALRKNLAAA